jgi:putative ABC transport system permease protein
MIKYYLKIAWRNISRHKIYTAINVLGLALGICACVTIYLIVHYEFSFDTFHPDGGRIYRIVGEARNGKGEKEFLNSPFSDVGGFQHAIPGFEAKAGFHNYSSDILVPAGKDQPAKKFGGDLDGTNIAASILTGPDYFSVFQYDWLAGNAAVLDQPNRVVLAESAARKYFGNGALDKMIGKTLVYADTVPVAVGGIVRDWGGQTDLGYTHFVSIRTPLHGQNNDRKLVDDWSELRPHGSQAFVKLGKGVSPASVDAAFADYIRKNVKLFHADAKLIMYLQPLSEIHFTKDFHRGDDGDDFRKPYKPTLYALMGLALFILVIAAVNFINLSTAQSMQRAKEVGVRKVIGSSRSSLVWQFLLEALVLTFLAEVLSVLLVRPVLGAFHEFIPAGVVFHAGDPATLFFLLSIMLGTTVLAGFYPARVLSSYLPVLSLKGVYFQKGSGKVNLRKVLIVFQFTISLVFVIGSLVIGNQIRFMRDADKGFNSDAIVTVHNYGDREGKMKLFIQSIHKIPGVSAAIPEAFAPMGFAHMQNNFVYKGKNITDLQVSTEVGDAGYIPFYGMKLLAGRNILKGDSVKEVVINETYARSLGFPAPSGAVGQVIYWQDKPYSIAGVVADFLENSFHEAMKPVVIMQLPEWEQAAAVKLNVRDNEIGGAKATLAAMEQEWKKIFPGTPFHADFLNESIGWLYDQEKKTAWLVNMAMGITIFISCMGLFGLGMYTAQRRTKEIGIRKVLGASVAHIAAMLSKDFLLLVVIAFAIASPVAWYFMEQWLRDFAYRVSVGWYVFGLSALAAITITLVTIGYQAIKAALANPVKSLRTE